MPPARHNKNEEKLLLSSLIRHLVQRVNVGHLVLQRDAVALVRHLHQLRPEGGTDELSRGRRRRHLTNVQYEITAN